MKKLISLCLLAFIAPMCFAQTQNNNEEPEKVAPLCNTKIYRHVNLIDIEGSIYYDVSVSLKALSPDFFVSDNDRVKVLIKDAKGKKIYKKTFKNVYIYLYSDSSIEVKQKHFMKMWIWKSKEDGYMYGKIREKEGIL